MGSYAYFRRMEDWSLIFLLLHVNDMLITAKKMYDIDMLKRRFFFWTEMLKRQLSVEFEIKDLATVKKILGIKILRDKTARILHLS